MEELKIHGKYKKEDDKEIMRIINEIKLMGEIEDKFPRGMMLVERDNTLTTVEEVWGSVEDEDFFDRIDRHSEQRRFNTVLRRQKCRHPRKIRECMRRQCKPQ